MRYTPSGQAVTNFRVATNRKWVGNDGKPMRNYLVSSVRMGKQAETCNQYLSKGRLVLCEGRLKPEINIWNDQNGNARASYELNAFEVRFLGGDAAIVMVALPRLKVALSPA